MDYDNWSRCSAKSVFQAHGIDGARKDEHSPPAQAPPPGCTEKRNGSGASLKTNQIFYHTPIIATDPEIPEQDKLIVDLEARGRLLLPSARIDSAHIQV